MTNDELVLWAHALVRAWRQARSWHSKEWFNYWAESVRYRWQSNKLDEVKRYIKKAKASS